MVPPWVWALGVSFWVTHTCMCSWTCVVCTDLFLGMSLNSLLPLCRETEMCGVSHLLSFVPFNLQLMLSFCRARRVLGPTLEEPHSRSPYSLELFWISSLCLSCYNRIFMLSSSLYRCSLELSTENFLCVSYYGRHEDRVILYLKKCHSLGWRQSLIMQCSVKGGPEYLMAAWSRKGSILG